MLITFATSADGKTTVASNLSKNLADDGKRVLLINADSHRGRVHELLQLRQEPGLAQNFAALRDEFDYVVDDCSPLPPVVYTMTLTNYSDLMLSMVHWRTPCGGPLPRTETIGTLDRRQVMIINGVLGRASGYGYSYRYRYSFGYGPGPRFGWLERARTWLKLLGEG